MTKEGLELSLSTAEFWIQIFAVLVAVGIVGEVGFGIRHWLLNAQLHRIEKAEELERQAEIARLTKETEDARLATAKIQEKLAPRTLSADQQGRITEKLRQFSGTEFNASVARDIEAVALLYAVLEMFRNAGWIQRNPGRSFPVVMGTPYGPVGDASINVGILVHAHPSLEETAVAVGTTFLVEGLTVNILTNRQETNPKIHIEIGKKPPF